MATSMRAFAGFAAAAFVSCAPAVSRAQSGCDEEPPLQNFMGGGSVTCPCFIQGEQAGAALTAPAGDYPIEILRVGVGWGSQFGGAPQSLEQAIHVYAGGLPNPGGPIASLPGPVLTDGFVNEFDLEPLPGKVVVSSGPVSVTLEFLNTNSGNIFAPSVVHDGNGCQPGKNLVFAVPGGWADACQLGVTGDWVFYAIYRPVNCATSAEDGILVSAPSALLAPQPNPFRTSTRIEFLLDRAQPVDLSIYDVQGRLVTTLFSRTLGPGRHGADWNGARENGTPLPAGVYFVALSTPSDHFTRKLVRLE